MEDMKFIPDLQRKSESEDKHMELWKDVSSSSEPPFPVTPVIVMESSSTGNANCELGDDGASAQIICSVSAGDTCFPTLPSDEQTVESSSSALADADPSNKTTVDNNETGGDGWGSAHSDIQHYHVIVAMGNLLDTF